MNQDTTPPNPINLNIPRKQEFTWPVWGYQEEMFINVKSILGATAMWAIKQSPYVYPENLPAAIQALGERLASDMNFDEDVFTRITIEELRTYLIKVFEELPLIAIWNEPKIQTGNIFQGSSSRFHTTKPDYDFIDLHALARNVGHTVGMEYFYWKGN